MESNRNDTLPTIAELMETETYKKDQRFYEGFRIGYACGRSDMDEELEDYYNFDDGYDEGYEDGYKEGHDDAVAELFNCDDTDCEISAEKPSDEESLLEFLDSLSLTEQRAALVHLAEKWAELGAEKRNEQ